MLKYYSFDRYEIPGFGWALLCLNTFDKYKTTKNKGIWLMGNIMINRNWNLDQKKIESTFQTLKSIKPPTWLISYPEGTRRTDDKLKECETFCKKKDLPILQNVLFPRAKGFVSTIQGLRQDSHVKVIYDITLAYKHYSSTQIQVAPTIYQVHSSMVGEDFLFHVHVKRYNLEDLPQDDEGLVNWLIERFKEKDAFLENMKKEWLRGVGLLDQGSF